MSLYEFARTSQHVGRVDDLNGPPVLEGDTPVPLGGCLYRVVLQLGLHLWLRQAAKGEDVLRADHLKGAHWGVVADLLKVDAGAICQGRLPRFPQDGVELCGSVVVCGGFGVHSLRALVWCMHVLHSHASDSCKTFSVYAPNSCKTFSVYAPTAHATRSVHMMQLVPTAKKACMRAH